MSSHTENPPQKNKIKSSLVCDPGCPAASCAFWWWFFFARITTFPGTFRDVGRSSAGGAHVADEEVIPLDGEQGALDDALLPFLSALTHPLVESVSHENAMEWNQDNLLHDYDKAEELLLYDGIRFPRR